MNEYRYNFFFKRGIRIVILDINDFNLEYLNFDSYKEQFGKFKKLHISIKPDLIWTRNSYDMNWYLSILRNEFPLFPSPFVTMMANDKRSTYRFFQKYQPKTFLLKSVQDDSDLLNEFGNQIILKPRSGYGGDGIEKVKLADFDELGYDNEEKFIVQKFCDFSKGYEGTVSGNHDIRMVYIGGQLAYSTIRTNHEDFRVNVSQGGKSNNLNIDDIPNTLKKLASECLEKLGGSQSGVVGIDFGYDGNKKRWILIEINDSPGFLSNELATNKHIIDIAFTAYAKYFNKIIS